MLGQIMTALNLDPTQSAQEDRDEGIPSPSSGLSDVLNVYLRPTQQGQAALPNSGGTP